MESLQAENLRLLKSIIACRGMVDVHETIRALGDYLFVHGARIRWLRVYLNYPKWQQQSQLLNQDLDKDVVLSHGPIVFNTLISPRKRIDLRVGKWKSTGQKVIHNTFVMTKLYHKDDLNKERNNQVTLIEFVLKIDQAHVAICVLHRLDYRNLSRDLRRAANQQNLPANQAAQVVVPQQLAPVNLAHMNAGFSKGLQFYNTIDPEPTNESVRHDPARSMYLQIPSSRICPMNNGMPNMSMNTGFYPSHQNNNMNQLLPFPNSMPALLGKNDMNVSRHDPGPSNYAPIQSSNTLPMNNGMHEMSMNTGLQHSSNNNMNPLQPFTNNLSMLASGENDMSVTHDPSPSSNYLLSQSSINRTMNNGMQEMPMLGQDGDVDQMLGQNDASSPADSLVIPTDDEFDAMVAELFFR